MPGTHRSAAFAAGLVAPSTFDQSLMPRSTLQQGLVTGLSSLATYAAVTATQSTVKAATSRLAGSRASDPKIQLAVQAVVMTAGAATHTALARRDGERLDRAAARTAAFETALGAGSALAVQGLRLDRLNANWRTRAVADVLTVAAAGVAAVVLDLPARRRAGVAARSGPDRVADVPAVAAAAAVTAGVLMAARAEQAVAHAVGNGLARLLPGSPTFWRLTGQVTAAGATAFGGIKAVDAVLAKIERSAVDEETGIDRPPRDTFVSGGPASGISFESLSREGRRHVLTRIKPAIIDDVMGTVPLAEPVRVFVGLESAPTPEERVRLALEEVDRLGALDRSLLVLISPTGSGYVNYAALQAIELLALGDVSSVVMQYCLQPSFLSLDHVALGRQQNSMLWHALAQLIDDSPIERRPRIIMFGESLGAHTSQDVFLHQGTAGMQALGVDSTIWIGTPFASRWKDEVLGPPRPDVDPSLVSVFDSYDEYLAREQQERERLRYVMITHDEDGVPRFGWPVAVQEPEWVRAPRPGSTANRMRWRPFTTFFQVFFDMLNGSNVTPGVFAALGHDYRADLLDFVSAVYRLPATEVQRARLEESLPRFEKVLFDYLEGTAAAAKSIADPQNARSTIDSP